MLANRLNSIILVSILFFVSTISAQNIGNSARTNVLQKTDQMNSTAKNLFVQKAKSLGFSDEEITVILDQAAKNNLQDVQLVEYFDQALEQKLVDNQEQGKKSNTTFWVCAAGAVAVTALGAWLLYKLYQAQNQENNQETIARRNPEYLAALQIYPPGVITEDERQAAEGRLRQGLMNGEGGNNVVIDLIRRHPNIALRCWTAVRTHGGIRNEERRIIGLAGPDVVPEWQDVELR